MTTIPIEDYAYCSENALDLYHLFVNELNSKISNSFLKVGNIKLNILNNKDVDHGDHDYQTLETCVSYECKYLKPEQRSKNAHFIIRFDIDKGKTPILRIYHLLFVDDDTFGFPLNDVIVSEEPIICFLKWMEIVVNGMPTTHQVHEFNTFLQIKKEARDLKFKIEFLRRSKERRPSSSELDSILYNDHLISEIYKNGSRT
jgi:hypothetical protein